MFKTPSWINLVPGTMLHVDDDDPHMLAFQPYTSAHIFAT